MVRFARLGTVPLNEEDRGAHLMHELKKKERDAAEGSTAVLLHRHADMEDASRHLEGLKKITRNYMQGRTIFYWYH